jgi:hypothetical protein
MSTLESGLQSLSRKPYQKRVLGWESEVSNWGISSWPVILTFYPHKVPQVHPWGWQLQPLGGRPLVCYFSHYSGCYKFVMKNHIEKLAWQFPSRNFQPNISWRLCCLDYSACYIFVAKIHTNPHTNISPMHIAILWFPEVGEFQEHVT